MSQAISDADADRVLPMLVGDLLPLSLSAGSRVDVLLDGQLIERVDGGRTPDGSARTKAVRIPRVEAGSTIRVVRRGTDDDLRGSPVKLGDASRTGRIDKVAGRFVFGSLADPTGKGEEVAVVAFVDLKTVAFATARPDPDAPGELAFTLFLPMEVEQGPPTLVHVGIAGTRTLLTGSPLRIGTQAGRPKAMMTRRAARPLRLAIKIATPNLRVAHEWGDYHFARALKKSLERLGWIVDVDTQDVWYRDREADVVLTLRGRHRFTVDPNQINLLWIISHPDRLIDGELEDYDHVFVASDVYRATLRSQFRGSLSTMHQATDIDLFKPPQDRKVRSPVLFVGNSRREYRTMVRWCIEQKLPIALWGGLWEGIVPPEIVRGVHVANEALPEVYGTSGVLLNDHWDTMRDNGFLSNRLFDGSAAGAFIITDPVAGLAEIFGDTVEVAGSAKELAEKVKFALANLDVVRARADRAREIVAKQHTFDHRATTIVETVEALGRTVRNR